MFKARMRFAKEGRAKYISHLDLMHTMQRAMARCQMPLWFTEGFNQHAYVSVALPLSTGYSGEYEFLDFNLLSENVPINAVEALNAVFPEGLRAIEIYPLADGGMPLRDIAWSKYRITWSFADGVPADFAENVNKLFAQPTVEIVKRSKRGEKTVNMRELMNGFALTEQDGQVIAEVVTAAGNNNMSPEYLTRAIAQYLPQYEISSAAYHRLCVYNDKMQAFR
ncbi:TIGR03936 family radical SAM-associated protein [Butyricicoccus pullicaecorum]|uniref:Radical SAM-linked protein n=1 Tax=Butyricicoccus pullicaecorum 1.2 TaxID=1203606 RepID=R8W489_9FIRM|nr:TIGR03936 family radical SAM-associated protein [Butyricicoccus pullicaecorum]EOQ39683.1 radical SAM-linked protein [Butyricicoccus pullicaecorum 1.2]SKA56997.1 radical SAM-linked protein [Butyricicoccus pullicaecorum DSM 23266]